MKSNLLSKFVILYFAIVVIGFWSISTLSYSFSYKNLTKETSDSMYKEALDISKQYSSAFLTTTTIPTISSELSVISALTDTRIMILNTKGNIILDTGSDQISFDNPYFLEDFDSTLTGSKYFQVGSFFNYFDESTLSVIAPITGVYMTKGYVAIHISMSSLDNKVTTTFNSNYISYLIMLGLSFLFVIFYYFQIYKPIKEISTGAAEYGKGHLGYKIKSLHNDEIGRLGISLNYMASELNEMDDFQQKFISNISHDFRSPLTSIKGYLEAIQDGTIPPEMVNKYIGIVLFETDRLTKLTSNILTLNDLDPKSLRLDKTNFDINSIIRHTIETFEGTCKDKKISFKLTFSSKTLDVNADIGKIQQVVYNLIDNAIKFSSPNSTILVKSTEKGEKAYISIKDSGCGIAKNNLDKIWDRFYKSDSSRGKDKKGSGLGLAIVKEIIQLHGETIDVISTEGVGTEFIFTLSIGRN